MDTLKKPPTMRGLMPEGFIRTLATKTGMTDPAAISKLVNHEQAGSKHWPIVLTLAEESNPAGFASWAAANPEKLPAKAAA
jgi:hypothetical protein